MSPSATGVAVEAVRLAPEASTVEIRPVASRQELRAFVRFPYRIYRDRPAWVPPLEIERLAFLDRSKNSFFRHSEAELFLAFRDGEPVGRIAAIENRRPLQTYGDGTGFFGFFESVDDQVVAGALVGRAADWARSRGLTRLRGPASFTINDECGLLLDAYDRPPVLMMSYNPPYYVELLEGLGFVKAQDLYAFRMEVPAELPRRLAAAETLAARRGFVVRKLDFSRLGEEIERVHRVHSQAWAENWGAVPLTREEVAALARELVPIADRDLVYLAERNGEPVGVPVKVGSSDGTHTAVTGNLNADDKVIIGSRTAS